MEATESKQIRTSSRRLANKKLPDQFKRLFTKNLSTKKVILIHEEPNVYLIKDFLSEKEQLHFLKICDDRQQSFENSWTESEKHKKVISEERSSTYIHLRKGEDGIVRRIEQRAAEMIGMFSENVEPLQIVSYQLGELFNVHHDAGTLLEDGQVEMIYPLRYATFFVYLNTLPEGQGCTEFPSLDIAVTPSARDAVFFSNVCPYTGELDPRTIHRACPITIPGYRKLGVNIWVTDCNMQSLALETTSSQSNKRKRKSSPDIS